MSRFADAGGPYATFDDSAEDLFENAPCGYLATAPDGTLLRVNDTFLRWTGYRREDLVGVRRFRDLLSVGGRIYHETHLAPLLRMQGSVREIAVDIVAADGERLPVLVNSVLVRDPDGTPHGVRTTVFDATERKLYERELLSARDRERAARERVESLQRITARLAAAVSSDAVAEAVAGELSAALGAVRAGVDALDAPVDAPVFDEGGDERGACVRLPCDGPALLWLEWEASRAIDHAERAFLLSCALQTGLALERARRHEVTREVAHELQRSLLTSELPQDPRFEVATAYHAAVEDLEVGGDWYDAFCLPSGRIGIVVGDVVGRGLGAASAMGQLRSAVRALAATGEEPAALLGHLDTYVEQLSAARYATLVYAEVTPADGGVTIASAGHPPAIVTTPGGAAELLMAGRSTPIGVTAPGVAREQAQLRLEPGGGFLLYTDGLVERRREPIDVSLERLVATIRTSGVRSPARLVATLLGGVHPGAADDDICLLSFRLADARDGSGDERPAGPQGTPSPGPG